MVVVVDILTINCLSFTCQQSSRQTQLLTRAYPTVNQRMVAMCPWPLMRRWVQLKAKPSWSSRRNRLMAPICPRSLPTPTPLSWYQLQRWVTARNNGARGLDYWRKSLLVIKNFQTWFLIGWQLCCQPIRNQVCKNSLTLVLNWFFRKHKNVFSVAIISQHSNGSDSWSHFLWKTRTLSYAINTMACDDLVMRGVRASAAMVLT